MFRRILVTKASSHHRRHRPVTRKRRRERSDRQDPSEVPNKKRDCISEEERLIHKRLAFQWLLESKPIQEFLNQDTYLKSSDKYLLAMVQCYFLRAGLTTGEYTNRNFFAALSLAIGMEEDVRFEITLPLWAGLSKILLNKERDHLLARMDYRGYVSRQECEKIFAEDPSYWAWNRERTDVDFDGDFRPVLPVRRRINSDRLKEPEGLPALDS